jgi:phosphatidate cytidylyltransferase
MKRNVKFNSQRRLSKGSLAEMDGSSPTDAKSNGPRSPTRNGNVTRPAVDRTDTGASGWATENDSDDQVHDPPQLRFTANATSPRVVS